jgi:hypothetical protein
MSTPPPLPAAPRRKVATVILVVCACLCTLILLIFLIGYLDREGLVMFRRNGPTQYFYPADLKTMNLPAWQVTNAIPLTPDQAVLAAMRHASTKHPGITTWDVDRIDLHKEFDTTWTYSISLIGRGSGRYAFEVVRVLMDGSVWKPTTERRER